VIKKHKGKRVSASLLKCTAKQCGVQCPHSVTLEQARDLFQEADAEYAELKKHAPRYHDEFLRDRAANKSGDVPENAQKAARRLLQQEKQRSDARHLKRVLAKLRGGAISRIEVEEN
jgi:hypothetical protein